jgi:hypothetical protein
MKAETVEVPLIKVGNKLVLTDQQLAEKPWLRQFVERYQNCFEYNHVLNYWVFYPGGK